jgi:alpha-glucosidase
VEDADPASSLNTYRRALALRHELQTGETLEWIETGRDDVLRFVRPNGWQVVTSRHRAVRARCGPGDVVLGARRRRDPGESTVWLRADPKVSASLAGPVTPFVVQPVP